MQGMQLHTLKFFKRQKSALENNPFLHKKNNYKGDSGLLHTLKKRPAHAYDYYSIIIMYMNNFKIK
jgi:hypothetical protein